MSFVKKAGTIVLMLVFSGVMGFAVLEAGSGFSEMWKGQVAQQELAMITHLQNSSVFVSTGRDSCGTGLLIYRNGVNYVLTAAHVVRSSRTESPEDKSVTYSPIIVMKGQYVKGKLDKTDTVDGKVVAYSAAQDLALIRLSKVVGTDSVTFKRSDMLVGGDVMYVGTYLGNPRVVVSTGILSASDFLIEGKTSNLSTVTAYPGASGGGLYDRKSGECIGVLVRALGENFNASVPVKRITEWAEHQQCMFVVDPQSEVGEIKPEDEAQ